MKAFGGRRARFEPAQQKGRRRGRRGELPRRRERAQGAGGAATADEAAALATCIRNDEAVVSKQDEL